MGSKGRNGVEDAFANWLAEKTVGAERFSDRAMKLNFIIRDAVWEEVSCYCQQTGKFSTEKKEL